MENPSQIWKYEEVFRYFVFDLKMYMMWLRDFLRAYDVNGFVTLTERYDENDL